ncbi:hypothetical protein RJ640_013174, partial [Escallonia rubra]
MDLNYALRVDAPAALTTESSTKQKAAYEKWERSNRISLMIMKGSITTAIRGAIPDSDNAKLYLAHIEERTFGPFKINYNTQKENWKMSELISMCVQEEDRLKSEQPDSAHVAITGPSKGKGKKFGKGSVQGNKSASVTKFDKASSSGTKGSSGPRCHFCKDKGHMRKNVINSESGWKRKDRVSISVIQKVGAPLPHIEDNDAPEVVPNDVPLIMDPAPIPANKQPLRRSRRERRTTISDDYIVYLDEDDILLASSDMHMLHETKKFLSNNFDMKDLGEASYVIGIEIHRDKSRGILELSQRAYIDKVLKMFNMQNCAPTVAPVVKGDKFSLLQCPRNQLEQDKMERIPYASAVGSLMYAQVCTRPDIAYAVGMLGRYQINPGLGHWKAAKKVMRYLHGCVDSLKSTSGYVFMLAEGPVSWKSAKQSLVASHTMEAEAKEVGDRVYIQKNEIVSCRPWVVNYKLHCSEVHKYAGGNVNQHFSKAKDRRQGNLAPVSRTIADSKGELHYA